MAEEKNAYLEQLRFDPELKKSPVASYFGNIRLVVLVLLVVVGVGFSSFFQLPRELNPTIDIPFVIVSTALPGASPEDVESLVTVPLEDRIKSVDGLDAMNSTSRENVSTITLEFSANISADDAVQDVQAEVDKVTDLPDDASDPTVSKVDFEDTPVWTFALTGGSDTPGLMRFSEDLRDRLEEDDQVDRVEVSGLDRREIQIIARPEVVYERGIDPNRLSQTIQQAISSYPAGNIVTDELTFSFTIDAGIEDLDDLRTTRIVLNGEEYTIGEVATITENAVPSQARAFQASPDEGAERVVTFNVYKTSNAKINEVVDQARSVVDAETEPLPQVSYVSIRDFGQEIDDQFTDLGRNSATTVFLVFLVMLLFLGMREAVMSSLSIPLAILISFGVMQVSDISLNFLSLFSLLIALGLLVDNAIVVVSALNAYYRSGRFSPYEAGLLVFKDFFVALIATNVTTIWAFLPLLLATGIIGEFIQPIPIIVSSTILASAFVGFFLTLPIAIFLLNPTIPRRTKILAWVILALVFFGAVVALTAGTVVLLPAVIIASLIIVTGIVGRRTLWQKKEAKKKELKETQDRNGIAARIRQAVDRGFISLQPVSASYKERIRKIILSRAARWQVIMVVTIFLVVSFLLPVFGLVQNVFFPSSEEDIIYVQIELPSGTNIAQSEGEMLRFIEELRSYEYAEIVTGEVGQGAPSAESAPSGDNVILFTINLIPSDQRDVSYVAVAEDLRERFDEYERGTLSVAELSGGPPAGADLQINYLGPDLQTLDQIAEDTMDYLDDQEGVVNIDKSIKAGTSKYVFVPDSDRLVEYGLSERDIGTWTRTFASGFELDSLKIEDQEYDIVFRLNAQQQRPEDISAITIPTSQGPVPLLSLGDLELESNPTIITRQDGERRIAVTATVQEGFNGAEISEKLTTFADQDLGLGERYSWEVGGVNQENQESLISIFQAMGLSAVLILLTLVLQLGSFRKAIIVMLVSPLAVSGVLILFGLFGIPLSFPAMIGLLALFGIVVNNSILVVEKINQNLAAGFDLVESITDASASRLEPIALTTMTTIIGLVPITLSDPLWQGLGGAIITGLTFSGATMLFFIPVIYYMWFKDDHAESS